MNPSPDTTPKRSGETRPPPDDHFLDAELRRLPSLKAPATLIPRVLGRLQAARPWWQCSWFVWPVAARLTSALTMLSLMGLVVFLDHRFALTGSLPEAWQNFSLPELLQQWLAPITHLGQAPLGVLQSYGISLTHLLAVVTALYLATIGLGTAWFHLAAAERSRTRRP